MQKYRTQEEVPWRDILAIIRRTQKISFEYVQWTREIGMLTENDGSLRNLRTSCACSRQLRRFLGRPETKMDRRAAELLESLDF